MEIIQAELLIFFQGEKLEKLAKNLNLRILL